MLRLCILFFLLFQIAYNVELSARDSLVDSLRRLDMAALHDSTKVKVFRKLMFKYYRTDLDSAKYYADRQLQLGLHMSNDKFICYGYQGVGLYYYYREELDSALVYLKKAGDRALAANDSSSASRYLGNMAMIHARRGQHEQALEYLFFRLRETEKQGLGASQSKTLNNIAYVYQAMGKNEEAIRYSKQDLALKLQGTNEAYIQDSYANLGSLYLKVNKVDSAQYCFQKSLALIHKLGLEEMLVMMYGNFTELYLIENNLNLDSVKYYALKQIEYAKKFNVPSSEGNAYTRLATYYQMKDDHAKALELSEKASKIWRELDFTRDLIGALEDMAISLNHLGRFKEAYVALHESKILQDSVYTQESTEAISELQVKYETEKKEQEIALQDAMLNSQNIQLANQQLVRNGALAGLVVIGIIAVLIFRNYRMKSRSNLEISSKNEQLGRALNEREALIKEIHHRVKNNLQIIASLLYLQSDDTENQSVKELLEQGQGRVRSMALIHQKLYENEDLKSIPFDEYLNELILEIRKSFGPSVASVQLDVKAPGIYFDVETAVPLGLIINELSTNAFKYAFNNQLGGILKVHIQRNASEEYEMLVADNGHGISDEALHNTDSQSLGLKLTRMLSDQLEGEYDFSNKNGTTFELKFSA